MTEINTKKPEHQSTPAQYMTLNVRNQSASLACLNPATKFIVGSTIGSMPDTPVSVDIWALR